MITMIRTRKVPRFLSALFALSLLAGGVLAAAPAANAAPWNCPISGTGLSRSVICHQGTGGYRVVIHCIAWHRAKSWYSYGPWFYMNQPKPSTAWCGWTDGGPDTVGAVWYQTTG